MSYDVYANQHDKVLSVQLWKERRHRIIDVLARTCFAMKDYHSAILAYEQLETVNADPVVQRNLGKMCLHAGDGPAAMKWFQKSCTAGGALNSPDQSLLFSGFIEIFQGNYAAAVEKFTTLAERNKSSYVAANNAAVALLYIGRITEATAIFQKLIATSPESVRIPEVCANLSSLYELQYSKSTAKEVELLMVVRNNYLETFDSSYIKL
ncbi:unnamed protein product [Soboliphyme baturini]|uniref:TPR_REGION domain-containing protein n=1 Tax=Soboliphyme baturini TaxID=241478 RepID=A0A183J2I0_9BILA|nr:unnamed protein product [Soboliphyme baturini]